MIFMVGARAAHSHRTRSERILAMRITFADQMDTGDTAAWNSLLRGSNPFVRHEFLSALEHHGAVGGDSGWEPCHVLAWQDDALVGALPLYLKQHSWGEFVFDWSWAAAYHRAGQAYYPKLVAASPYSPCTGPRLLVAAAPQPPCIACFRMSGRSACSNDAAFTRASAVNITGTTAATAISTIT